MSVEQPGPVPEATATRGTQATGPRPPIDDPQAPRLTFTTRHLRGPEDLGAPVDAGLLDLLTGRQDVVSWVRHGMGMVGWGRALTLQASGEERIAELRRAWRGVVGAASWTDDVHRPGTGPVALGAIAGVIIYLQKRGIINICCCDDCDFDDFQQDKQPEENETKL